MTLTKDFSKAYVFFIAFIFYACSPITQSIVQWSVNLSEVEYLKYLYPKIKEFALSSGLDELKLSPTDAEGMQAQAILYRKNGDTVFSLYKSSGRLTVGMHNASSFEPSKLEAICNRLAELSTINKTKMIKFSFENRCNVFYHPKRLIPKFKE